MQFLFSFNRRKLGPSSALNVACYILPSWIIVGDYASGYRALLLCV